MESKCIHGKAKDQPLSLPGRVFLNGTVATISPWLSRMMNVCPDTSWFCMIPCATRSLAVGKVDPLQVLEDLIAVENVKIEAGHGLKPCSPRKGSGPA